MNELDVNWVLGRGDLITKKRLIVDEDYNTVDTVTSEWLDDTQVFDLANELAEENQELKQEIVKFKEWENYYKAKCGSLEEGLFEQDRKISKLQKVNRTLKLLVQNWENLDDEKDEQLEKMNDSLKSLVEENQELKQEIVKFKKWENHIERVKREDLDRVFKMSIYEIAEAFEYYRERIKELEK